MQEQLILSSKMLSLGVLGAGMAHEINNPLNIIQNYNNKLLRSIEQGKLEEDLIQKININIEKNVTRIKKIIGHLQEFSGADHKIQVKETVDVEEVLNGLQDFHGGLISRAGVKLQIIHNPEKVYVLECRNLLEQVLLNILHNAIEAVESTSVKNITISTVSDLTNVIVSIHDTGIGISEDIQSKIYDPFFTTKDSGLGRGLGLSLVRTYLQNMNGEISFSSIPGDTKFEIKLQRHLK